MVAPGGACIVDLGGMHGCSGGACVVAPGGACVVAPGGHVHGCSGGGHAWVMTRYGDTINERAVRILLECILVADCLTVKNCTQKEIYCSSDGSCGGENATCPCPSTKPNHCSRENQIDDRCYSKSERSASYAFNFPNKT